MENTDKALVENLARAIEKAYISKPQLILRSFIMGIFTGLGATIGVTLILIILSVIAPHIPFFGSTIQDIVHNSQQMHTGK